MKMNKPLNIKIGFYFFITNLLLVILLGSIFYFSSSNLLIQKDILAVTASVQRSGNYIELYTKTLTSMSDILSKDSSVSEYLKYKDTKERKRILYMMHNLLSTDPYIKTIILIGKDGEIVSNEKNVDMKISNNMMKEEWYVEALKNSMPVLNPLRKQNFSENSMENWVVSVSREIHDEMGNNLGVLLIDVKYQAFQEYLKNRELGEGGDTIILDEQGRMVYYKNIPCLDSEKTCLLNFQNVKEGYDSKTNKIMVKYPIKNTNWVLMSLSSLEGMKSLKKHFFQLLLMSCFVSLLLTFIISAFILKRITQPVQELEKHMRDVSNNLSKISLTGDVSTEILSLQNHFNEMIEKIKYLREYEINALYSQINPHFLYNTLDTIIWMAEFEDTQKVILITKSLANFFRISLSKGKEKIPLLEEMKHVEEYLYIQKQRYEDKLEYSVLIEEELQEIEVPKIILQPIVENAIYHGIKNLEGTGRIQIYSQVFENRFELIVEDNGVGFERAKHQNFSKIGGIGIKNVNKRIQFYYGEDYGVFQDENFSNGTRMIIRIPR